MNQNYCRSTVSLPLRLVIGQINTPIFLLDKSEFFVGYQASSLAMLCLVLLLIRFFILGVTFINNNSISLPILSKKFKLYNEYYHVSYIYTRQLKPMHY